MTSHINIDRAMGSLFGQAIGDALGTTYEFMTANDAINAIKNNFKLNGSLPIVGNGPFELVPGQITDDTELALGLGRSLVKCGEFNRDVIVETYIKWANSHPFDMGHTTSKALKGAESYGEIVYNSKVHNMDSQSNGSLMRISPLGIWIVNSDLDNEKIKELIKEEVQITHPSKIVQDATRVYVLAIHDAILHREKNTIYKNALENAETEVVKQILLDAQTTPFPIIIYKRQKMRFTNDTRFQGYFGVALQNTFYEFLHTETFYQSLINIISRGGDTDTNAAIAGAFLGAFYGLGDLPKDWVKTIINCKNPRVKNYSEAKTSDLMELAYKLLIH